MDSMFWIIRSLQRSYYMEVIKKIICILLIVFVYLFTFIAYIFPIDDKYTLKGIKGMPYVISAGAIACILLLACIVIILSIISIIISDNRKYTFFILIIPTVYCVYKILLMICIINLVNRGLLLST